MYTLLICLWPLLQFSYNNLVASPQNIKDKVTRNIVAFSNALGTLLLGTTYYYTQNQSIFNLAILYPTTYYIYDTYLILNKKYYAEYPYIYHHLITIYLLQNLFIARDTQKSLLLNILISAELSNLPIYPVYHIIKTGNNQNVNFYKKLISWKKFQIFWYILIRVFYFSYVIYYKYYDIEGFFLRNLSLSIYLLGVYWVYGQIKSLKNDIKLQKELLYKND